MDAGGDRPLYASNIGVIREVYDSEYAQQTFSLELERALHARCSYIVIEPSHLGDETARWIRVGNCLHKTAVLSGIASLVAGFAFPYRPIVYTPLGLLSLLCTSLYTASWQSDHCVKYQVEKDPQKLTRLPEITAISAANPVVLVRKDDTRRKLLHCTATLAAASLCSYKLYHLLK